MYRKSIVFLSFLMASLPSFAIVNCPCPGPCCPGVYSQLSALSSDSNKDEFNGLSDVPVYLSPYVDQDRLNQIIENDLQKYKTN